MRAFAERWSLPVGCSFRRQALCDHLHPNYAGDVGIGINPKLAQYQEADLVLLVGCRFGEMPSSDYTLLKSPYPDQTLVHVHPDPANSAASTARRRDQRRRRSAFAEAFSPPSAERTPAWANRTENCIRTISPGRRRRRPAPARCRWGRS
jgi:acetolactate synthase-1/2/3 large subunit